MSDEVVEKPVSANKEEETRGENANNGTGNSGSTKEPKTFSVHRVKFGPELTNLPEEKGSYDAN